MGFENTKNISYGFSENYYCHLNLVFCVLRVFKNKQNRESNESVVLFFLSSLFFDNIKYFLKIVTKHIGIRIFLSLIVFFFRKKKTV